MAGVVCVRSMPLALLAVANFSAGCAAPINQMMAHPNYQASLQTVATPPRAQPIKEIAPDAKASDYLAMGLNFYQANQKVDAAHAFTLALDTGNLNDQGRALAYWHLFLAHRDSNLSGPGAEALQSFITVSNLLFQEDKELAGYVEDEPIHDFIEGFNLNERFLLAELLLDAIWARRDPSFGRTPERAVLVRDIQAERLFVQLFKPCDNPEAAPSVEFSQAVQQHNGHAIDRAQILCPGAAQRGSFFFTTDARDR